MTTPSIPQPGQTMASKTPNLDEFIASAGTLYLKRSAGRISLRYQDWFALDVRDDRYALQELQRMIWDARLRQEITYYQGMALCQWLILIMR